MNTHSAMTRALKNRHIQMIALGSSIGTGLFLTSGSSVQTAGPVVLLGYIIAGAVIFMIMRMLGEMAVARPESGSFSAYAHDYCGETAGFITGWNWWFTCIVVSMLELSATGVFLDYWFPNIPHWVTALIALILITGVNLIHVKAFGEFEFWFTIIKVAAVVAMIVFGLALIFGIGGHQPIGLDNLWSNGGFAPHGLGGFMLSLVAVTFTFGGIESIGTAAGETEDPARSIPKAINRVIVRILVFYVGAIGIMLVIWPWNRIGLDGSPFVLILVGLGIGGAAALLNVVVITAALSVYNTMVYSNARVLHSLAEKGQAPKILARTNDRGVPVVGILVNSAITGIVVLLNYLFPGGLILVLVAVILCAEIITWSSIVISHLRFRKSLGEAASRNAYRSPWHPYTNYLVLAFFALLVVLMAIMPDFQTGAIALPIWLAVLTVGSVVQRRIAKRRSLDPALAQTR